VFSCYLFIWYKRKLFLGVRPFLRKHGFVCKNYWNFTLLFSILLKISDGFKAFVWRRYFWFSFRIEFRCCFLAYFKNKSLFDLFGKFVEGGSLFAIIVSLYSVNVQIKKLEKETFNVEFSLWMFSFYSKCKLKVIVWYQLNYKKVKFQFVFEKFIPTLVSWVLNLILKKFKSAFFKTCNFYH